MLQLDVAGIATITEAGVQIVGEAANGIEALEQIPELRPDVVFLDIEMPGLNGFEVAGNLIDPPLIVFATAFDEFAVKAFEENALDYVLKPVQARRIAQTLSRVKTALGSGRSEYDGAMREVLGLIDRQRDTPVTRLAARRGKRIIVLNLPEVMYLRIDDKLVFAHVGKDRLESTGCPTRQSVGNVRGLVPLGAPVWLRQGEKLHRARKGDGPSAL